VKLFAKIGAFTEARRLEALSLYPYFKPITGGDGTTLLIEGEPRLNMGSNNYLGLTHHPRIVEAGRQAALKYGTGCTGSRFLNGTLDLHLELEELLARLLGKQAALVYPTGYQANVGLVSGLVGRGETVIIDKADHASIIDGARLSFGTVQRFDHRDYEHLERLLNQNGTAGTLIIVDGVHSMSGELADVPRLVEIAERHDAALAIDDAHAVGVFGPRGEGTPAHFGVTDRTHLIVGTFSKSLASIGGFVAGDEDVLHYLKHHSRPLIFSAALPPFSVASVLEAVKVMLEEPERREHLWENTRRLTSGLRGMGYQLGPTEAPIIPIIVGELDNTFVFWRKVFDAGVFTNPVAPPAVPPGSCRLRVSLVATHTSEQIDRALEVFERVGREHGLIG
jgi:8-amino-7-oxononanoate synthase